MYIHWSTLELKILKDERNSFKDVFEMLGRSEKSIRQQAIKVGRKFKNKWEHKNFKMLYLPLKDEELANILMCSLHSVRYKRTDLGIKKRRVVTWTENEINVLKLNMQESNKELSKALDRSIGSIQYMKRKIKGGNL